jgi:hypothetical protein
MHESQFPNVGFLAKQILGMLSSQIKTEWVFSLAGVLTTLLLLASGEYGLDYYCGEKLA